MWACIIERCGGYRSTVRIDGRKRLGEKKREEGRRERRRARRRRRR
jgi:hypothetical protein